jgi:ribosomal protein L15
MTTKENITVNETSTGRYIGVQFFLVRKNEKVKVLGNGDISVAVTVTVDKVSKSAEQKIVAAGGSIK